MTSLLLCIVPALVAAGAPDSSQAPWWDARVSVSLRRAPDREKAWEEVLRKTPAEQRPGVAYLVADLPLYDLRSLPPEQLAGNVALAYQARALVAWGAKLPGDVFLDAVLPYASLTEPRDSMRGEFFAR